MTDHTLFTFPTAKAFASGKLIIYEIWVERLADDWIATSSPTFATAWPGFHKLSRGPSIMTFFSGSPASSLTSNFCLDYIELPWVRETGNIEEEGRLACIVLYTGTCIGRQAGCPLVLAVYWNSTRCANRLYRLRAVTVTIRHRRTSSISP